jgi:sensor histidine kinase regulating citrate/malate metabolism
MVRFKAPQTLQAKIILVLVAVILPTYLLVTVIQNKLIQPILEQELRQLGTTTGEALAGEISSNKLFYAKDAAKEIEKSILQRLYFQPSIVRMDVYEMENAHLKFVVSSIDDDPSSTPPEVIFSEINTGELIHSTDGVAYWKIFVPIKQAGISKKAPPKVIGMVRVLVSTKTVQRLFETFWKITLGGALISVFILIILLNFFLKKTIAKEKLLKKTESQNIQLSEQLHEAERQMMNLEKLEKFF